MGMTLEFWDRIIDKMCNNERKKGTGEYKDILLGIVVDILWEKGTVLLFVILCC